MSFNGHEDMPLACPYKRAKYYLTRNAVGMSNKTETTRHWRQILLLTRTCRWHVPTNEYKLDRYEHIKQEAYEANMQLPKLGLVLFTFGNVSAADRNLGVFAIKPSGVPYEDLSPAKMVI